MMDSPFSLLKKCIMDQSGRVEAIQRALTATPALGPENGGNGEIDRVALLEGWLSQLATARLTRIDSPDDRVPSGIRPNLIATIPGKSDRTLWLFAHMDVVPPGDLAAWESDPWQLYRDGDVIYGRGVEDNQQAIASMLILAECLARQRLTPEIGLGLVFMSDEECGSRHGLRYILENSSGMFSADDFFIVPDGGAPDAASIEVAEKSQLWLKFTITGRQCHASTPSNGINAFVAASDLALSLASLNKYFPVRNKLFAPPCSTFTPTRHLENSQAINILPGRDIFYMDCRLLPEQSLDEVMDRIKAICEEVAGRHGAQIEYVIEQYQESSSTPSDNPVLPTLQAAVKAVYGVEPKPIGIGGATVAAFLRKRGLGAVVWSCIRNTCHQPNEMSSISATCRDAAVFSHILLNPHPETSANA